MKITLVFLLLQLSLCAKELRISFGDALPPWVKPKTNDGLLLDIIRTCLEPEGYKIIPVYHPYARRIKEYQLGSVDIVSDVNENIITKENLKGKFSGYIYAYENFAYSLSKKGYNFKTITELTNHSIISWQGASDYLGPEYAKMAKNNKRYVETSRQKAQVQMLFLERYDVIQMDDNIFMYYKAELEKAGEIDTSLKYDSFPLFGKSPNGYLFRDHKIQKLFLQNLKKVKDLERFKDVIHPLSQRNKPAS